MSYPVGSQPRINGDFTNEDGVAADPTTATLETIEPDGTTHAFVGLNDPAVVGRWYYRPLLDSPGTWKFRWVGAGALVATMPDFTIHVESSAFTDDFPAPTSTLVCAPWATTAAICEPCNEFDPEVLESNLLLASEVLYVLSGRQFRGAVCEATVRPQLPCGIDYGPCGGPYEVLLPHYPVTEVTEVKVRQTYDGILETLTADQYRLDNHSTLIRLQDSDGFYRSWPRQEIRQNSNGTGLYFEATYTYGQAPPLLGLSAARDLACEFALACDPSAAGKCKLPKNVQSVVRQGVSQEFIDVTQFLAEDLMGIHSVDVFLRSFNKSKLRRRASVWSPDLPSFRSVPFAGS